MKTKSANVQEVTLADGRVVCLSYGVIVAAFIPRNTNGEGNVTRAGEPRFGYLRTDARFSVTTSRHMNAFAGKDAREIPHAELVRLCAPIVSRQ